MKSTEETVKPTVVRGKIGSMSEQTITEFLEARIAEDETVVYNVMPADVETFYDGHWVNGPTSSERLLAECAAKRAIIESYKNIVAAATRKQSSVEAALTLEGMREGTRMTLAALTFPYKDHPDHAPEWAL